MYTSFILTTIAGLATLFGTIPIFIKIKDKDKLISISCAFASGVMICISVVDLIPESIRYLNNSYDSLYIIILSFIFIVIGIITSYYLDVVVDKINDNNNLFKVGILAMIVIIIHNIPEGIVTYIVSKNDLILGISICLSIAIHNIPEGISIAIPIYYSTGSKIRAFFFTLISALSELFGAIITYLFLEKYIGDTFLGLILSFTAGIMLCISLERLRPTATSYNSKLARIAFIFGIIFMLISLQLDNLIS